MLKIETIDKDIEIEDRIIDIIDFSSSPRPSHSALPQSLQRDSYLSSKRKSSLLLCWLIYAGNNNRRSRFDRRDPIQAACHLSYIIQRMEILEHHIQPNRRSYKSSEAIRDILVFRAYFQEFSSSIPPRDIRIASRILQHNFAAPASSLFLESV